MNPEVMEMDSYFLPGHSAASKEDQTKAKEIYEDSYWPIKGLKRLHKALIVAKGGPEDLVMSPNEL